MPVKQSFFLSMGLIAWLLIGCGRPDPTEDSPFLKAIRRNQFTTAQELLRQNPDLLTQQTEVHGLTALHVAARYAKPEMIQWLIEAGAEVNARGKAGETPLHEAADIMHVSNANRILMLLEAGADPALKNQAGQDVWELMLAQDKFELENQVAYAMGFLLRYDYQPDKIVNEDGKTILHELAGRCPAPEPIELLITEHDMDPDVKDVNGWTPLHFAALKRNYPAAEVLLRYGAKADATTTQGVGVRGQTRGGKDPEAPDAPTVYRYRYPEGSTPMDILTRSTTSNRRRKSLRPLLKTYL